MKDYTSYESPKNLMGAAEYLGLSPSTVYRLTREGKLDSVKVGRRRLYLCSTLRDFLQSREGK